MKCLKKIHQENCAVFRPVVLHGLGPGLRTLLSLSAQVARRSMTKLNETQLVHVYATFSDGNTEEIRGPAAGLTYSSSMTNAAAVSSYGLLTAIGTGHISITIQRPPLASRVEVDVVPNDFLTTVTGTVVDTNGVPVAGATVRIFDSTVPEVKTDAAGEFRILDVPTMLGPLGLDLRVILNGRAYALFIHLGGISGGQTLAGMLVLRPIEMGTNRRIAVGGGHTIALRSDGTLWAWGDNGSGQLGVGQYERHSDPVQVETNANWRAVDAGFAHTVALRTDGSLWAWGENNWGQLGAGLAQNSPFGPGATRNSPLQVGSSSNWNTASAGKMHTVALTSNGTRWIWGDNSSGQLGGTFQSIYRYQDFGCMCQRLFPFSINSPFQLGADSDWSAVVAGAFHTMGLRLNGSLWSWGNNRYGALGDGTTSDRPNPVQVGTNSNWNIIAAGENFTTAIRLDGTLWAWGVNDRGQLGDGTTISHSQPLQVETNKIWVSVAVGAAHTLAIRSDGSLWAWGDNSSGQLGDGTVSQRIEPVQVGATATWHTIAAGNRKTVAIRSDGTLWTWGDRGYGQSVQTLPDLVGGGAVWGLPTPISGRAIPLRSQIERK